MDQIEYSFNVECSLADTAQPHSCTLRRHDFDTWEVSISKVWWSSQELPRNFAAVEKQIFLIWSPVNA
jgi:hypothetical protein